MSLIYKAENTTALSIIIILSTYIYIDSCYEIMSDGLWAYDGKSIKEKELLRTSAACVNDSIA